MNAAKTAACEGKKGRTPARGKAVSRAKKSRNLRPRKGGRRVRRGGVRIALGKRGGAIRYVVLLTENRGKACSRGRGVAKGKNLQKASPLVTHEEKNSCFPIERTEEADSRIWGARSGVFLCEKVCLGGTGSRQGVKRTHRGRF